MAKIFYSVELESNSYTDDTGGESPCGNAAKSGRKLAANQQTIRRIKP